MVRDMGLVLFPTCAHSVFPAPLVKEADLFCSIFHPFVKNWVAVGIFFFLISGSFVLDHLFVCLTLCHCQLFVFYGLVV